MQKLPQIGNKNMEHQTQEFSPLMFYNKNEEGYYLTNFYDSPFSIDGKVYKTNEHYFQSKKYQGLPEEQLVIDAKTPREAFDLGRNQKFPKRKDWELVKQGIMYEGLLKKFTTHEDLRDLLLSTKNRKLIEHTQKDRYWADGGDGSGKNRLGSLLMKLRNQLQQESDRSA